MFPQVSEPGGSPSTGRSGRIDGVGIRDDWRRLCGLIDDDQAVWEAVEAALDGGGDAWEALLDGLDEAGALAYLQTEDTGMELTDALVQLPRVFATQPDLDTVTDTDDLAAATRLADRLVAMDDLRVIRLEEEDDAWPLIVVPEDRAADVIRLAAAVGGGAVLGG